MTQLFTAPCYSFIEYHHQIFAVVQVIIITNILHNTHTHTHTHTHTIKFTYLKHTNIHNREADDFSNSGRHRSDIVSSSSSSSSSSFSSSYRVSYDSSCAYEVVHRPDAVNLASSLNHFIKVPYLIVIQHTYLSITSPSITPTSHTTTSVDMQTQCFGGHFTTHSFASQLPRVYSHHGLLNGSQFHPRSPSHQICTPERSCYKYSYFDSKFCLLFKCS